MGSSEEDSTPQTHKTLKSILKPPNSPSKGLSVDFSGSVRVLLETGDTSEQELSEEDVNKSPILPRSEIQRRKRMQARATDPPAHLPPKPPRPAGLLSVAQLTPTCLSPPVVRVSPPTIEKEGGLTKGGDFRLVSVSKGDFKYLSKDGSSEKVIPLTETVTCKFIAPSSFEITTTYNSFTFTALTPQEALDWENIISTIVASNSPVVMYSDPAPIQQAQVTITVEQ